MALPEQATRIQGQRRARCNGRGWRQCSRRGVPWWSNVGCALPSYKLVITAERAEDGKLRCTCATWDDAVVMLKGEAPTLVNIERQADDGKLRCTCATCDDAVVMLKGEAPTLVNIERQADDGKLRCTCATWDDALGAKAPADVVQTPRHPDLVRMISRPLGEGARGESRRPVPRDVPAGRCGSGPLRQGGRHASISVPSDDGVGTPDLVRIDFGPSRRGPRDMPGDGSFDLSNHERQVPRA